ncbi:hypothetical protein MGG_17014 [Pyricularia oryzae 70-15]|uniref:Uncharacterized protein n=1 Tax=Pyricularia oryzae (strain 70-15 / ATCC MYA-4617 / FGSC 8958) TaxID=242507 RepID=G4NA74_PYRO7|nr:uncharacterized protein MGG_17014 [Pyricularia oryzae 70-15]EHA49624.1 hypothetical protein MGG_17014 [Pyricularia oryzae 70-15]
MQFPQLFIIIATVFAAAVQAKCTPPVNGACPLPPGTPILACTVNGVVTSFVQSPAI